MNRLSLYLDDRKFTIPSEHAQNTDVWVHEFTESTLFDLLGEESSFNKFYIPFHFDGEEAMAQMNLVHLMASLSCHSGIRYALSGEWRLISPDEFIEMATLPS